MNPLKPKLKRVDPYYAFCNLREQKKIPHHPFPDKETPCVSKSEKTDKATSMSERIIKEVVNRHACHHEKRKKERPEALFDSSK